MSGNKRLFVGRKKVEDRFTIISDYDDEIGVKENQSGDVVVLKHNDLNAQQFVAQLVLFLNDQNQAIVDLYDGCEYWSDKASERITLLEKENEQLKEALKELKEIGDYQEMRIQELCDMHSLIEDEIDKKIAVLTDAKIKSFQNGDEELFGKIKFSIQVLRELKERILE